MRLTPSKLLLGLCAGLFLLTACSANQAVNAPIADRETGPTPEELVVAYSSNIADGDYVAFAQHMHPDELAKFRDALLPLYDLAGAEDGGQEFLAVFSGGRSAEEMRAVSPAEFLGIFIESMAAIEPAVAEAFGGMQMTPIGSVRETTDEGELVHVVVRTTSSAMGIEIEQVDTVSLRQYEGTWKMMLSGEIEAMANAIAAQLGMGQATAAQPTATGKDGRAVGKSPPE